MIVIRHYDASIGVRASQNDVAAFLTVDEEAHSHEHFDKLFGRRDPSGASLPEFYVFSSGLSGSGVAGGDTVFDV